MPECLVSVILVVPPDTPPGKLCKSIEHAMKCRHVDLQVVHYPEQSEMVDAVVRGYKYGSQKRIRSHTAYTLGHALNLGMEHACGNVFCWNDARLPASVDEIRSNYDRLLETNQPATCGVIPTAGIPPLMFTRRIFDVLGYVDEIDDVVGYQRYVARIRSKFPKCQGLPKYNVHFRRAYRSKSDVREYMLAHNDRITVAMATMPSRYESMLATVERVLPQCDELCICLNGFSDIPDLIYDHPKIRWICTDDKHVPDLMDTGKFWWADKIDGYYLTIDDDIAYPEDYVQTLVDGIDRYDRQAIVGTHGIAFGLNKDGVVMEPFRQTRRIYNYAVGLAVDTPVHMIGTGTSGYHTAGKGIAWRNFNYPNGADAEVAIWAQQHDIPIITLAHETDWMPKINSAYRIEALSRNKVHRSNYYGRLIDFTPWRLPECQS